MVNRVVLMTLNAFANVAQASDGCPDGTVLVEERRIETQTAIYIQPICRRKDIPAKPPNSSHATDYNPYAPGFETDAEFIPAMLAAARAQGLSEDEIRRAELALDNLGLKSVQPRNRQRATEIWSNMRRRSLDPAFLQAAARGAGSRLFESGWQSGRYDDCALFALATAADIPYGVVAASTNELLAKASWRVETDRKDTRRVFQLAGGLNGGEVIVLAELFGRAAIVRPDAFASTVSGGRPILISVATAGRSNHQVVLTRTFKHQGSTWFELIDSGQKNVTQHLFLTATELTSLLRENGVTVAPEKKRAPRLLRSGNLLF